MKVMVVYNIFNNSIYLVGKFSDDGDLEGGKVIVPVPVPVYIPVPMAFYKVPQPYPLPIPVPIPVPYFIPTTKKNADSILKHIKVCSYHGFIWNL